MSVRDSIGNLESHVYRVYLYRRLSCLSMSLMRQEMDIEPNHEVDDA
jgi:hypothetical protein